MNNLHLMTRTEKGIGGYTDSVSYKLANGDLSREEAAVILQTLADNERLREALRPFLQGTEWLKPEHFEAARAALSATERKE